ncbi:MAG TPA: cache domain-containing protein [Anaerolineales bacterium]|nr:cache domain-containing protein [Anaerolineales bacterium]
MLNSQIASPQKMQPLAKILSSSMLLLSITGMFLLIAVGLAIYPAQRTLVETQQQLIAQQAAQAVDSFIQAKFSKMEAIAKASDLLAASTNEQQTILQNLLGLDRGIRLVSLYDAEAREIITISRLAKSASGQAVTNTGSDVFVQLQQAERYVSHVYFDDKTSEPLVVIAIPVKNVFNEYQGLMLAEVNLKFLWDLIATLKVGENGYAYVVDRQGNLIALRDTSRVLLHENLNQVTIVKSYMADQTGTKPVTLHLGKGINNTQTAATYFPLGEPDWAVITEMPVLEANRVGIQTGLILLAVVIMMASSSRWVASTLARRISAPIVELTRISQQIASGDLALQAPVQGPQEISSLAESFNTMTAQLRETLQGFTRRTRALETSQEVSRRLAEIFDERQLVTAVVTEVQTAFNYYHAHIYLFDETQQNLRMVGGTGEAGRQMLLAGHRIPRGRGLVGRAAETRQVVLISDVSQASEWLPNPLLPETRSEVAVPIHLGETVYGVLDVQQNYTNGLTEEDAQLLEGIANQVAIALQNARSYTQARQEAEQEALINAISQKIQQANSIETILQVASRELALGLGAKKSAIHLRAPQKTLKPSEM